MIESPLEPMAARDLLNLHCCCHMLLIDAPDQQALAISSKLLSLNLEIIAQQDFLGMLARLSDRSASKNHENCCSL